MPWHLRISCPILVYRTIKKVAGIIIFLTLFAVGGCGPFIASRTGLVDVSLVIPLPDYVHHNLPGARMVDPSTRSVEVTVTATDFEPMTTAFDFANHGTYVNGAGIITCTMADVPAGSDRTFTVATRDTDGAVLTSGSAVVDVSAASDTVVEIYLLPAVYDDLSAPVSDTPATIVNCAEHWRR